MKTVFVDTSALLPLLNRNDVDHAEVVRAVRTLSEEEVSLVTTSYVLVESAALVKNRLGQQAYRALGRAVEESMEVIWVTEDLHDRAWVQSARESRTGPGLVDWVSFLVMRDLAVDTALALDRHFLEQEFSLLPD